jgi:uncharacterized protein YlzI (FlbEa/FlbD family)
MFIRVGDYTINPQHIQHITHQPDSIILHFAGQGGEIVLKDTDAKLFLQKLTSDHKPGQFYSDQVA